MKQIHFGQFAQRMAALTVVKSSKPTRTALGAKDLIAAIASAGTSQAAIAEFLGVSTTTVNKVIHGQSRSRRVEAELEKITGTSLKPAAAPGRRKTVWTGRVAA